MTRRADLVCRLLAAIPGGYILASLGSTCVAQFLPGQRIERVMVGMFIGLFVWPALFMGSFAATNGRKALIRTSLASMILSCVVIARFWYS